MNEPKAKVEFEYPSWLFNLDVIRGSKERALSGYPTFYPIYEAIAAGAEETYTVRVGENELWFVDNIVHADVLPDVFYLTVEADDQPMMSRQVLRIGEMATSFPSPFPITGAVTIKVENEDTDQHLYQCVVHYRRFSRPTVNHVLEYLGMERI